MQNLRVVPFRPVSTLLVEDDPSDAFLIQHSLENTCNDAFVIKHVSTMKEAMDLLHSEHFDVVLLDLSLPGYAQLEALANVQTLAPRLPVIILTGNNDENLALSAMKQGAQDYLIKDDYDGAKIKRAIRYAIERKQCEENLAVLANYDALTGLANRSLFESRLEMSLARSRRSGEPLAVFFLDLDHFKQVNDSLGHDAGDMLLKDASARLKQCLREYDTACRFGGDEFAVLIEGMADPRNCAIVAQKIMDALTHPFSLDAREARIGVSIGIAISAPDVSVERILRHADTAMYRAKSIPRSNFQFYTPHIQQEALERLQLEQDLGHALSQVGQLSLFYQPKLEVMTGKLIGAEALIRWLHPEKGVLRPEEFIPVVRGTSIAPLLDEWVIRTVGRDMQDWKNANLPPLKVSIHLAQEQWHDMRMLDSLLDTLQEMKVPPEYLAIELEESAILPFYISDIDIVSRVRATGLEVHLDNFGADATSLRVVTQFTFDMMKIDRYLIRNIHLREREAVLVRTLIEFGHRLNMRVIAEGVEHNEQKEILAAMGCDFLQGEAIAPPLRADTFFYWIVSTQYPDIA